MLRIIVSVISSILVLASIACTQEVLIADFPLGVGGTVSQNFFKPYYPQLQAVADTLRKYPLARGVVTGGADGVRFAANNDAKNPGLALGRAHALRNVLIRDFHVDSTQLLIQSVDVAARGGRYRSVSVRIERDLMGNESRPATPIQASQIERPNVESKSLASLLTENMGLRLSAGVSSSPFGGIPIVAGAISWKKVVFIEGLVGHTFWNNSYRFQGVKLDTWRRMAGGQLTVFPLKKARVGFVGGWFRIEEISQKYYEFVKLSEGPVLGMRVTPFAHASVTGSYNPARHRIAGDRISRPKNDQFLISVTLHTDLGGAR
ncbi:MAG: hypothetical protein AB1644_12025 [Candidatus Zixiibacteriota bacterium]